LSAVALAGLATGFGAGFGAGLGFGGTGTVTVLVMVCVVDEPGEEDVEPAQTVTDPEPNFEPWLRPEPEDPELQAIANEVSKFTKAAAIRTLVKAKLAR
jgi:hypothetical protein